MDVMPESPVAEFSNSCSLRCKRQAKSESCLTSFFFFCSIQYNQNCNQNDYLVIASVSAEVYTFFLFCLSISVPKQSRCRLFSVVDGRVSNKRYTLVQRASLPAMTQGDQDDIGSKMSRIQRMTVTFTFKFSVTPGEHRQVRSCTD